MTTCARWVGLALGMVLLAGAATSAQAAAGYGSAAFATARPCAEPAAEACVPQHTTTSLAAGGKGQSAQVGFDLGNGSASSLQIGAGEAQLPQMRGAVTSSGDQRVGATGVVFRSYAYEGSQNLVLGLSGDLHFTNSFDDGVIDGFGDGTAFAFVAVFNDVDLGGLGATPSPDDIFNCVFGVTDCWPFRGLGETVSTGASGETSLHFDVDPLFLRPGGRFVVAAGMQLFGNRGGFVDASDTFSVGLDPDNSFFTDSPDLVTRDFLLSSIVSTVPEPASWTLMIAGFGLAGMGLRGRRRRAILTERCSGG